MLPEIANFILILACVLASLQVWLGSYATYMNQDSLLSSLRRLCFWQGVLVSASFALLIVLFIRHDFSVHYVAANSHTDLPWYYCISATWGAHEGSMLLWLLILSAWQCVVAFSRGLDDKTRMLMMAVMGAISVGVGMFIILTSNPFTRDISMLATAGRDLNPLLQDPGLIIHPPILYAGYVGMAVAYSLALAMLIRNDYSTLHFQWLRHWLLLGFAFLTAGITLGSWWAYRVLGWGGWWFWDPVENASFMPWLIATALLHSLAMVRRRQIFEYWTLFLAILVFSLSLLGTFLVRSGVLSSVHAFANDPERGLYILGLFILVLVPAILLLIMRLAHAAEKPKQAIPTMIFYLFANTLVLFCLMIAILSGTLYPLIIEVVSGIKLSVGAPYFNLIFIPFALILLTLMAAVWIKTWLNWVNGFAVLISLCLALGLTILVIPEQGSLLLISGLFVTFWAWCMTLIAFQQSPQQTPRYHSLSVVTLLGHSGILMMACGVMLTSSLSIQKDVRLKIGESTALGHYRIKVESMQGRHGPNYQAMRLNFSLYRDGETHLMRQTYAEKRLYTAQKTLLSHPAIIAGFWRDFYIAIGDPIPPDAWSLRVYYKPFVRWIWAGGILILLGGLLGFYQSRSRRGEVLND